MPQNPKRQEPALRASKSQNLHLLGEALHFLAACPDVDLLLPRASLEHLAAQHGFDNALSVGSRFGAAFDLPLDALAERLLGMVSSGLAGGSTRQAGACFEFEAPGPSIGVDAAVFGREPDCHALKEQGGKGVLVPAVFGSPSPTRIFSAIMVPATLDILPADAASDSRLLASIDAGRLRVIWSIFPGASILPNGLPFPPSSSMIGSGVCLIGSGPSCSQAEALEANAIMQLMDGFPSARELVEILEAAAANIAHTQPSVLQKRKSPS